ncbi:MAG: zinc-ribbon domain-containing protein [Lachnospiraceae bacterium]|nr:zinc-ribbon domain-containing protein [Lachnospiraceae bacterium]
MAKYCPNCGKSVKESTKFCSNCGTSLSSAKEQCESGRKFCRFCGNPVREGAKFCRACGKSLAAGDEASHRSQKDSTSQHEQKQVEPAAQHSDSGKTSRSKQTPEKQTPEKQTPEKQTPVKKTPEKKTVVKQTQVKQTPEKQTPVKKTPEKKTAVKQTPKKQTSVKQKELKPHIETQAAATTAGEIDFGIISGELTIPGLSDTGKTAGRVLSPVEGIIHSIGSFLGGISGIFRRPAALIGVLLLAALWFVLARHRDSDSGIVNLLSFLTYAEGGFDRSGIGILGGILGKGIVAAGLLSLPRDGVINAAKGIGALFAGHGEKRGILNILLGIVLGAAAYYVFVGPDNASAATAMPGIAGALLTLEALGSGEGKLYELARSLTSRISNGIREEAKGRCDGLLTGLVLGFALATVLAAFM